MIALITGKLASKTPGTVVVDVSGVGYEVHIPLSSFYEMPDEGGPVRLHIHTHVREDAITLFGFLTVKEKELFLALMGVTGIGPKLALNIISGLAMDKLVDAIARGDDRMLATVPGVGKKTAARLVLELKEKVAAMGYEEVSGPCRVGPGVNRQKEEAVSALVNLGYNRGVAEEAVKRVCAADGEETSIEALIRDTLKMLAKG
ncbi:MAG: Holliday junction branch migration protein RuvA [Nitrospirae bacterium]|nr:Holliday junction branch migration protein RuvA [Nitrospirota bacterium]